MDRNEILSTAGAALAAGWTDTVEQLCGIVLRDAPEDVDFLLLQARSEARRGAEEAAVGGFRKALLASACKVSEATALMAALHEGGENASSLALAKAIVASVAPEHWDIRHHVARFVASNLGDQHAGAALMLVDENHRALMPTRIRLESASACNLRCQHCPTGVNYDATERSIMKLDLFERVLEQMKGMPSLKECVLYLGGEPLMNKRLVEMCQRVKAETTVTRTFITTNGMLLSERNCAALATAGLDQIFVSVDGRSPEENDAIRLRSRYATIVENVARLRKHLAGQPTQIVISHAMIRREGDPQSPEVPAFLKRDFPGIHVWTDYATRWPGFDLTRSELEAASLQTGESPNFCAFPFAELSVRVTGEVVLCCHDLLGESVMGNIWKQSLAEIWNGPAYRTLRKQMLARNPDGVHSVCKRCFVFTGERIERSPLMQLSAA